MERTGMASEASASRDAPAYDYGSFSGYRTSFSSFNQHPSLDPLPISSDKHGGYSDLPHSGKSKEAVGDCIPENYSYVSSYDDMRRRYGYGSEGGSYLSRPYGGETLDGKLAYGYESHHRPNTTPSTSGFVQDDASRPPRWHAATDERILDDGFYNRTGSQKNDLGYMSKLNGILYEQPVSGGWQSSEREFSYPLRGYNTLYEQSPSVYHTTQDRATIARRDDKNNYLLESKYGSTPSGHLPSSSPWSDWRSSGGIQKAQEVHEWKGSSSLSSIVHEQDDLNRMASTSRRTDGSAYTGLREYNKLSMWKDEAVTQAQFDIGKRWDDSSLPQANHVVKVSDSKEASMQVHDVVLPKSAKEEKKRRTRWGPVEESAKGSQDGSARQKKKSRWSAEKSPEKEVSRPDLIKELSARGSDIVALRTRLLIIETMLQSGQVFGNLNAERSPSPEPVLDNFGFRVNTREQRAREKLNKERQRIMTRLSELTTFSKPAADGKPSKLFKKIYIPVDKYPDYNFIGLIIGPRGLSQKNMEKESGAKISIRGKGSVKEGVLMPGVPQEGDNLHVLIEADSEESIKKATEMVEKLLIPIEDKQNEHKLAQLRKLASLNGTLRSNDLCFNCKGVGHTAKDCPLSSITAMVQKGGVAAGPSITAAQKSGAATSNDDRKECPTNMENDNTILYVESLPEAVDDAQLSHLFSPFGQVVHAKVTRHPTTGISKSYGFVKFLDERDAAQAVALMNGYQMDRKALIVKAKTNAEPAS